MPQFDPSQRVNALYRRYLNSLYATEYFRTDYRRTEKFAKHFDFGISLGAITGGTTGLGILAWPQFAWVCAAITTASVVLTAAQSAYKWPKRLEESSSFVEKYAKIGGKYIVLIERIQSNKQYLQEDDQLFIKLSDEEDTFSPALYPDLDVSIQRQIQGDIKRRLNYKSWWKWRD